MRDITFEDFTAVIKAAVEDYKKRVIDSGAKTHEARLTCAEAAAWHYLLHNHFALRAALGFVEGNPVEIIERFKRAGYHTILDQVGDPLEAHMSYEQTFETIMAIADIEDGNREGEGSAQVADLIQFAYMEFGVRGTMTSLLSRR